MCPNCGAPPGECDHYKPTYTRTADLAAQLHTQKEGQ
jgi:hypothetical protein